jgi:hypothetical protein
VVVSELLALVARLAVVVARLALVVALGLAAVVVLGPVEPPALLTWPPMASAARRPRLRPFDRRWEPVPPRERARPD